MSKPSHNEKLTCQENESIKLDDIQMGLALKDSSIQLRAYQIYQEKGGSDFDNWLEAEQILRNPTNSLATANRKGSGAEG